MTGYLEKQGNKTLWVTDSFMITKKMMKQAKKEVECLMTFAHHEFVESKDFIVNLDGVDMLYTMSVCFCGYVSVHGPDEHPQ